MNYQQKQIVNKVVIVELIMFIVVPVTFFMLCQAGEAFYEWIPFEEAFYNTKWKEVREGLIWYWVCCIAFQAPVIGLPLDAYNSARTKEGVYLITCT